MNQRYSWRCWHSCQTQHKGRQNVKTSHNTSKILYHNIGELYWDKKDVACFSHTTSLHFTLTNLICREKDGLFRY